MSDPEDTPRPPRAAPPGDEGLDAPIPRRMVAERPSAWRSARARHPPAAASLGLERNLGTYHVDSDTEETPPTASPGQFRFDGLDLPDPGSRPGTAAPPFRLAEVAPASARAVPVVPAPDAALLPDADLFGPSEVPDVFEPPAEVAPADPVLVPASSAAPVGVRPSAPAVDRGLPWLPVAAGLAVVVLVAWLLR